MSKELALIHDSGARCCGRIRLAQVVRGLLEGRDDAPHVSLAPWRVNRVRAYIDQHIADPIRLSDLTGVMGLSPMSFAAHFRLATGLRPANTS